MKAYLSFKHFIKWLYEQLGPLIYPDHPSLILFLVKAACAAARSSLPW